MTAQPKEAVEWTSRVLTTAVAADLMRTLRARHGRLMFHQSGGCCDGSAPMCYTEGEFLVGDRDVLLGRLQIDDEAYPVWISGSQFAAWRHTQLIIDAVPGRGAGFSIEAPTGMRFLTRSRVIPADKEAEMPQPLTGAEVERGAELPEGVIPIIDAEGIDENCPMP